MIACIHSAVITNWQAEILTLINEQECRTTAAASHAAPAVPVNEVRQKAAKRRITSNAQPLVLSGGMGGPRLQPRVLRRSRKEAKGENKRTISPEPEALVRCKRAGRQGIVALSNRCDRSSEILEDTTWIVRRQQPEHQRKTERAKTGRLTLRQNGCHEVTHHRGCA